MFNSKIVGAAFGNHKSEKTYSGVPKYLFNSLKKRANIVAYTNTKQLRPWDVFDGAVDFSKIFMYGKPGINVNWIWRRKTLDKLSARFKSSLMRVGEFNTILQMGTHVAVRINGVRHYCRTDMTVAQGVNAKKFSLARLKDEHVSEAIETQKSIFESCNGIFVTSNWVKESIITDYGIDTSKIYIVGLGASIATDPNIDNKQPNFNILFVGRNWQRKGGPILLNAFKRINENIPESKLIIIGCSPPISDPNVKVLGYLDKNKPGDKCLMSEAYLKATVLCVPSCFEPFGICFAEAQFCGVVPVTFAGEGRRDAIKDGITGVLVEERSSEALSEAILALLNNPDRIKEMSTAGRRFVTNNFTWDHVAERILDVIEKDR